MVLAHVLCRLLQGSNHLRVCFLIGSLIFSLRHKEFLRRKLRPVNQLGILDNSRITVPAHFPYDAVHNLCRSQVLAKKLLVGLPDAGIQLHLVKSRLLQ